MHIEIKLRRGLVTSVDDGVCRSKINRGIRDRWFLNFLFYEVDAGGHNEMTFFLADQ
jgi:hypothetical protein